MPSTDELLTDFEILLAQGFSIPNARRLIENRVSGRKQLERLRKALDWEIADREILSIKKEESDGEDV